MNIKNRKHCIKDKKGVIKSNRLLFEAISSFVYGKYESGEYCLKSDNMSYTVILQFGLLQVFIKPVPVRKWAIYNLVGELSGAMTSERFWSTIIGPDNMFFRQPLDSDNQNSYHSHIHKHRWQYIAVTLFWCRYTRFLEECMTIRNVAIKNKSQWPSLHIFEFWYGRLLQNTHSGLK